MGISHSLAVVSRESRLRYCHRHAAEESFPLTKTSQKEAPIGPIPENAHPKKLAPIAPKTFEVDCSKFKTRFACEVKDFDPTTYLDRKEARKIDRYCQFALIASDEAVKDAGITKENVDKYIE